MPASSETPAQSPPSLGDRGPSSRPRRRGRMRLVIVGGVVIVTAGLVVAGLAVTGPQDPGEKVPKPHRAAAAFPRPAAGQPRWSVQDHHWTGLSKAWTGEGLGPNGSGGDTSRTRLVSDGRRAIAYAAGLLAA